MVTQRNSSIRWSVNTFCIIAIATWLAVGGIVAFAAAGGVTAGSGSLLDSNTGEGFLPRGFNSIGVLYPAQYASAICTNSNSSLKSSKQEGLAGAALAIETAFTSKPDRQLLGMERDWKVNILRFPVSQGALQYEYASRGKLRAYTDMVRTAVAAVRRRGLIVILAMQTAGLSCTPRRSSRRLQKLPDHLTEEAWKQLLDDTLSNDPGVMLEIFSEPNTQIECGAHSWKSWATGCGTGSNEGMLTVGKFVRSLSAKNVLLFDGDNNAGIFNGFTVPAGMPSNSAYVEHPYDYVFGNSIKKSETEWDNRFGKFQATGHSIVAVDWSEASPCPLGSNVSAITEYFIRTYLPTHHIGLVVASWDGPYPVTLVNTSSFAPINSNSACAVTGAPMIQKTFWRKLGSSIIRQDENKEGWHA